MTNSKNPVELQLSKTGLAPAIDAHVGKLVMSALKKDKLQLLVDAAVRAQVDAAVRTTIQNVGWSSRDTVQQYINQKIAERLARGDIGERVDTAISKYWDTWAHDREGRMDEMIKREISSQIWESRKQSVGEKIKEEIRRRLDLALSSGVVEWVDLALSDFIKSMENR